MSKKEKTIVQQHKKNFETLRQAFLTNQISLMDCIEKKTGEHVAVICAMTFDGKEYTLTPFAKFFNGNPYDMLIPPGDESETTTQRIAVDEMVKRINKSGSRAQARALTL